MLTFDQHDSFRQSFPLPLYLIYSYIRSGVFLEQKRRHWTTKVRGFSRSFTWFIFDSRSNGRGRGNNHWWWRHHHRCQRFCRWEQFFKTMNDRFCWTFDDEFTFQRKFSVRNADRISGSTDVGAEQTRIVQLNERNLGSRNVWKRSSHRDVDGDLSTRLVDRLFEPFLDSLTDWLSLFRTKEIERIQRRQCASSTRNGCWIV